MNRHPDRHYLVITHHNEHSFAESMTDFYYQSHARKLFVDLIKNGYSTTLYYIEPESVTYFHRPKNKKKMPLEVHRDLML